MRICNYEKTRGPEDQPILIVGDSRSKNVKNIREVLDKNHLIYNSIIIPIKYYTEKYLNKHKYKLTECFNDKEDIFRYVNAIEDSNDKKGLNTDTEKEKLYNLKDEVYDENNEFKYRIIISLGDFAYFAVRVVLNRYEGKEQHRYSSRAKNKYDIKTLGEHFNRNSKIDVEKDIYILPILHNISNRINDIDKLIEFIPKDKRENYISYYCYIGECLGKILVNDIIKKEKYKNYLHNIS
ncbi:hypothetical protein LGL08_00120 [Clostridium estertheticum]|uniref:hypothetical protein n=1 Tax=Clostridium estertheticum TaxID=238834 RepID=UPI001CF4115B|nr:hypothetical protein [Clostridium estertheticum]MCB2305619.1 hypothetical protein [Clostridium estertheticum]MCB2344565.1 hypothetical protein [Clostridium estertheticum]MCB2347975.1 hypothetical protein [Clostridium estertheticum]WAG45619.1 hypothetical protein LL127_19200 [Clostridium estertheticum]